MDAQIWLDGFEPRLSKATGAGALLSLRCGPQCQCTEVEQLVAEAQALGIAGVARAAGPGHIQRLPNQ